MTAAALITAAGNSTRMGTGRKKEYETISGRSVLARACEPFCTLPDFLLLCIVVPKNHTKQARELLSPLGTPEKKFIFQEGGRERQDSVRKGLLALKDFQPDYVLIHDAARPWITPRLISQVLEETARSGACVPVLPPPDAIKTVDSRGFITRHLRREMTVGAQTPQGFLFKEILKAHLAAEKDGNKYIDDTEIYHRYAGEVRTVPGDPANRKVTYLHDLERI